MNSFKNHSLTTKKYQDKISHSLKNSTSVKTTDRNDNIIGMVLKNIKPKLSSSDFSLNSTDKNSESKLSQQSNCISHQMQAQSKHPDKRKDEKGNHTYRKKMRIDTSTDESQTTTVSTVPKRQNKFKSAFPKTYICKYCCRRYHSVEQLRQHSAEHGSKPSHICHLCNHQTASFSALMTHYLKHSGSKGKELEKIYAKSKADFSNIQFNIFSHPKSSFQCNKCKINFSSKSKYDSHNCSAVIKKSEYKCAYCGHVSTTVEEYRNHIQSHSETPFICSYCKYKAMSKKQLDAHREQCKKRRKLKEEFKCDKCSVFQGKNKKELNFHLKTCGKETVVYTCEKCQSKFQEKKCFDDHLLVCKINEKQKYAVKKTVKSKKKIKESVAAKSKLACCVCEIVCSSKAEHEEHERQCLAEMVNKPVEKTTSSQRGNTADTGRGLQNNKIFSDQKDVGMEKRSLNTDNNNMRRSARLVRRRSSYLEDDDIIKKPKILKIKIQKKPRLLIKPKCRKGRQSKNPNNSFLCNYCDFTFCSKSTLLRHKRMHSGNPWYICQYCGKFFFRKDVYIRHEENVHKKSSKIVFCCYYCKLCFNESALLKEHVVAMHKGSAFLPIKQKLSGKSSGENIAKPDIKIKLEPDDKSSEIVKKNSGESKNVTLNKNISNEAVSVPFSSFKCSICLKSFENAGDIETHMKTHGNYAPSSSKINNVTKSSATKPSVTKSSVITKSSVVTKSSGTKSSVVTKSIVKKSAVKKVRKLSHEVNKAVTPNKSSTEMKPSRNDPNVVSFISPAVPSEVTEDIDKTITEDIGNEFSDFDEQSQNTEMSDSVICRLCSKKFSDKKLYEIHRKTPHKIVDWYRCLVCTACGPKQEMLNHMFMHMCKVGSFVVNNNKDYENIIALQVEEEKKNVNDTSAFSKEQDASLTENMDVVSYDELPPLREYGVCPCIDGKHVQTVDTSDNAELQPDNIAETQGSFDSCSDMNNENDSSPNKNTFLPEQSEPATLDNVDIDNKTEIEEKEVLKPDGTNLSDLEIQTPVSELEIQTPVSGLEIQTPVSELEIQTPVKENCISDLKSEGNSVDNQNENFSQLRYLLQSSNSQNSSENKIPMYPFSQLDTSDFTFDKTKVSNPQSPNLDTANIVSKNNFESSKQVDVASNEVSYKIPLIQDNNQSINTCLKFDVNQSRSEFSENLSTSSQKTQNCAEIDKNENIFKTCPPQNAILDFSDLIHHSFGNSSPSEDNLFSYATTSKQNVLDSSLDMREEVHTPDCTDMANYDSTGVNSSVKCENCSLVMEDRNEQVNHECAGKCSSEQSANADICQYKSKSTFQSLAFGENQNKSSSTGNSPDKKINISSPQKSGIFKCSLCSKITISEIELLRHQKTEHVQSVHNSPQNNECTKCHRTFNDIGELMKHSLTCLRTYFLKNAGVGDSVSSPECLQTLLRKDEPKTNFSNFSLNSSLPFNAVVTDISHQTSENILKHSFNS